MKLNTWAQSISEKLFSLSFLRKRFPSLSDVESFLLSKVSWHLMSHVRSSSAEGRQRLRKTLVNNAEQKFPSSCSPTRSVHIRSTFYKYFLFYFAPSVCKYLAIAMRIHYHNFKKCLSFTSKS